MSERLMAEHRRQIQLIRTSLDLELDSAKRSAAALKDKVASLTLRRSLLQDKRMLTEQRLRDLDQEIVRVTTNREAAGRSINGQEQVLTVMMLDLQMAREKEKRDELQRQLTIGLAEENDQVTREEADLQRAQQEQDGRIAGIQARIAHLSETRLVDEPQRSQRPVGLGGMMILALGLFAGLVVGMLVAFLRQAMQDRASRNPSAA
jgi:chromosome segregation ATPase